MVSKNEDDHEEYLQATFERERETQNREQQSKEMNLILDQIEGPTQTENSRAADVLFASAENVSTHKDFNVKDSIEPKIHKPELYFPVLSQSELSTLYCFSAVAPVVLWNALKSFFEEAENVDPQINEESRVIFGNYYNTPQDCSFLASVAQMKDSNESVLDVRRLHGDAFLLNDFYKTLHKYLAEEAEVVQSEFDDDEEDLWADDDDYNDLFADDMELGLELPSLDPFQTMMEFEYDPEMLYMMIADFKDTHVEEKSYFMSVLSHNSVRDKNRELMLDEQMHDSVKELIECQLRENKDRGSASLTRNTCLFLKNLASEMKIDDGTVKAAVEAMGQWCPGQDAGVRGISLSTIGELSGSRQSMIELCKFFQHLIQDGQYSEEDIINFVRETLEPEQINRIGDFVATPYDDCLNVFSSMVACN